MDNDLSPCRVVGHSVIAGVEQGRGVKMWKIVLTNGGGCDTIGVWKEDIDKGLLGHLVGWKNGEGIDGRGVSEASWIAFLDAVSSIVKFLTNTQ